MSSLGTYSFLPWLRQGLANQIQSADFDATVKVRARVDVKLNLSGEKPGGGTEVVPADRTVALVGPGDIVGIEHRAIVRTEPRNWITNFEPNYLAHIEFYDEDFPWRYTPAAPDLAKGRLRPWIALVVLTEAEFKDGTDARSKPLPYIEVPSLGVFPRADELWAWAHVHVNRSLAGSDAEFVSHDMNAVLPRLTSVLGENPDLACSRLLCPRKLAENEAYHAFIVPVFEAGRRAGLGIDIGDIPATMSSWDAAARPDAQSFPYYHRWFFRTGTTGDFETLVRLLVPRPVDPRVGTRDMDVQYPGSGVRGLDKPSLGGILRLGGALRPPTAVPPVPPSKYETWDQPFPRPLQVDLTRLLNLPDDLQAAGHPDPIITPPLYGTWHALAKRVVMERDGSPITSTANWLHRLNLDPRFRVAAGIGTRVIQDNQERYMDAAWEQIGRVLEAQRRIRFGQFGLIVSSVWFDQQLQPTLAVSQQQTLVLTAPLHKRVLTDGVTVFHAQSQSLVQPTMTSTALRRIVRPRGRLVRSLPFDAARPLDKLLERVNDGEVSAAPPTVTPPGVPTTEEAAKKVLPAGAPPFILNILRRWPSFPLVFLLVSLLVALLLFVLLPSPLGMVLAIVVAAVAIALFRIFGRWREATRAADLLDESGQTVAAVDDLPTNGAFRIAEPDSGFVARPGGDDSVEATRFKTALREHFALVQATAVVGARPIRGRFPLARVAEETIRAIDPRFTIPRRVLSGIFMPPRIGGDLVAAPEDLFVEPMAYPVIDQPMYEPLKARSAELFLPNINLIESNSITLLETNQEFIESYMVGLNHEFARELLWREYPTDQRGSTFRQFWDVSSFYNANGLSEEALKEQLHDIPPLHLWSLNSALGTHDNREATPGTNEQELVLVIRGELLKRYPTAVIYAHRACWQRKSVTAADANLNPCLRSGAIDNTQERSMAPLTTEEEANPPRSKVLTPLYEAKVDPDISFFGFDLTVAQAKGGTGANPDDDPGWFFVIKERPGEPRFGLDGEQQPTISVWNDLSWPDVQPAAAGSFIEIASAPGAFPLLVPGVADQEKATQHADDVKVTWSHDMSSAELGYILFQAPVLIAVHATEMLPR